MSRQRLGKIAITPKGKYNATTQYERLDCVTYEGNSYVVLKPVVGETPTESGGSYQLLAKSGDKGEQGDVSLTYANTTYANAPKATVRGNPVVINDISPVQHVLKVRVIGLGEDPSTTVVVRYNPDTDNWDEFLPNADGTVDGITSFYPTTEVRADSAVNEIEVEYNRDISHTFADFANALKGTASGNILRIEDISPLTHPISVKVKGVDDPTSVKVYRSGINALPYPFYETSKTVNGITFTDNGDGTVTANGTATAAATFWCSHNNQPTKFTVPPRSVFYSGCPEGGSSTTYAIRIAAYNGTTWVAEGLEYGDGIGYSFKGKTYDNVRIGVHIYAGATVENLVFMPMVELATAKGVYEPFVAYGTFVPNADGTVDGISSIYPDLIIMTDTDDATLEVEYNQDISKAFVKPEDIAVEKAAEERKNYCIDKGKVIALNNDFAEWSISDATQGAIIEDTTFSRVGNSGLKLAVTTAGGTVRAVKSVNLDLSQINHNLYIWIHCDTDITAYQRLSISLFNANGARFSLYRAMSAISIQAGWNLWSIRGSDWLAEGGTPSWNSPITKIRVEVMATTDRTCHLTVSDMRMGYEYSPKIIFRFDDALQSVFDKALPILDAASLKCSIFANSALIEDDEIRVANHRADLETMKTAYNNGHDIGNHSATHRLPSLLTYAETVEEIKTCQDWLLEKGFTRSARYFAVPGSKNTDYVQAALDVLGVTLSTCGGRTTNQLPLADRHNIKSHNIDTDFTVEDVTAMIDDAIEGGNTFVMMFHGLVDEPLDSDYEIEQPYQYTVAKFQAIVDYIVNNNLAKYVVRLSDWYEGLNRGE